MANQFSDEEVSAALTTRDNIINGDINELKGIYMAGEIVMWHETLSLREENEKLRKERDEARGEVDRLKPIVKVAFEKVQIWKKKSDYLKEDWEQFKAEHNL